MRGRRKIEGGPSGWVLTPLALALVLILFAGAMDSLTVGRSLEDRSRLERALRRSCVACYVAEGSYPADLEYIKKRYGIRVDEERYTVIYSPAVPGHMPDITVSERKS